MRRLVLALCTAVAIGAPAVAQTMSIGSVRFDFADEALRPRTDMQKAFVNAYRAAVAAKSLDALRALVHPASLACIATDTSRVYLRQAHERDMRRDIPEAARIIFQPFTDSLAIPLNVGEMATLPHLPTEVFGLDYNWEQRDDKGVLVKHVGITVLRMVAPHDGRLMLVEYCLTPKGEEMFLKKQAGQLPPPASDKK